MHDLIRTLPLVALLALTGPAFAQDENSGNEEEAVVDPLALTVGTEETGEGPGSIYVRSEHNDWQVRCFRATEGADPCQLYQLLTDPNGNPVSEINVFPIPGGNDGAVAGATVVTPLETLLTTQLALKIDSGARKKYPFSWCAEMGCFARLGFTAEDILSFKKGNVAQVIIRPVAAPDQEVTLTVSLKGFTAAYDEAVALVSEAQ